MTHTTWTRLALASALLLAPAAFLGCTEDTGATNKPAEPGASAPAPAPAPGDDAAKAPAGAEKN
jgi:hypothetical protein